MKFVGTLVFTLLVISAYGLYDANSPVVQLTARNFEDLVINSNHVWVVEFYAPWCGHCKQFAPDYEKLAQALQGVVRVGAVDMTAEKAAGTPYSIKGYPTVMVFGFNKEEPTVYSGTRTVETVMRFALKEVNSLVESRLGISKPTQEVENEEDIVVLNDTNFQTTVFTGKESWFVEFYAPWCGHCKALQPKFQATAATLRSNSQIKLAKVDATENSVIAQKFGISGYPTLIWIPATTNQDVDTTEYTSDRETSSLVAFVNKQLDSRNTLESSQGYDEVVILDEENFDASVFNGKESWLVQWYSPGCGHCKAFKPKYEAAATQLKGIAGVKLAKVNGPANKELFRRFKIKAWPTLKWFPASTDKDITPIDYASDRDVNALVKFVKKQLNS
eukprot:CAMPEP_0115012552 /NCGR_PEP_ID=MMETSP0216-20121206/24815_1 /TAXON_ID=223996 /ORGANISM="Protocruzia adherens, Strain Boccale" /LENGTH=388 /DNA_ID=CAMNT_0002381651 /DNA_START=51 /DNA_END=1213 /DNA_ORIENTATION=+